MAATIDDKITTVSSGVRPVSTTVSTIRNPGATTLACADLTGWTTTEAVFFVTYRVDGQGNVVPDSQSDWKGVVSGSNINNLTLTGGIDNGNSASDIVEMLPTAEYAKELGENILTHANQNGTLKSSAVTVALTGTTLPSNTVNTSSISDSSITSAKIAASSVNSTKLDFGGTGAGIWWEEIGRATLTSSSSTLTVSSLPARKYLRILALGIPNGASTIDLTFRFNSDAGANYAYRYGANGSPDATTSSNTHLASSPTVRNTLNTATFDVINIPSYIKSFMGTSGNMGSDSTSVTHPERQYITGKWTNTSNAINSVTMFNVNSGTYAAGTEIIVLGHN